MTGNPTWTQRLQITSYAVHVATFAIAAVGEIAVRGLTSTTAAGIALALVGIGFGLSTRIPFSGSSWRPALTLGMSVLFYSAAITLTGASASTFTLMPVAAIFAAAAGGGLLYAAPVSVAAILGVLASDWFNSAAIDGPELIRISAVYVITAIAFSEVQRAVTTESERAEGILVASDAANTRIARLTATHDLLEDLVQVAHSPDMNAVTTAQDAIRDVALVLPDTATRIMTSDGIILARRGAAPDHASARQFPITCSGDRVAHLELWDDASHLGDAEIAAISRSIEPVGLAIDNDALLQSLAGVTISRERVRLARELHDDVAPSIAAVGLALDMALMSGELDEEQVRNLSATRSNVSRLVDQIRQRVQDLRADRSMSIVEMAHSLVAEVDADGPTVIVNIDERTPPRPAIAAELGAFITEAFRNALEHANATAIWITGAINDQGGFLAVQDNGDGFDSSQHNDGHFGLIGIRERAAIIPASLELESTPGDGTVVSMTWKDGAL